MKKLLASICFALVCSGVIAQQPSFIQNDLDNYIAEGMRQWQVPGLAIVIVKDGKIVKMQGYGVTNIQSKDKVNENTLFFIASNTKLFTGTALANLEYNHRLSLNDKITQYYPSYRLYDSTSTQLVTIKDMLSHRIGTKTFQGDFTFWNSTLSSDEIMNRMRYLQPINPFRQDYGYCNSCFLTAGQIIPKAAGTSWAQYITDTILKPLAMNNTHALSNNAATHSNIATPYTTVFTNQLKPVPYDQWDNLAPAASILSNVNDLSHWLLMQLDSGRYNGKQVLPWAVLQKTRDLNIITSSRKSALLPTHIQGYGLGVLSTDYNGKQVYWHTGGAGGMVSNVCFVPEEKLGIAILTNNDNQSFFELLRYQILDAYLGVPFVNRSQQRLAAFDDGMKTKLNEIASWRKRVAGNKPPLALSQYAGDYENTVYGKITVKENNGKLAVTFLSHANLSATLTYLDGEDWLLEYDNIEYGIFKTQFKIENSKVLSLTTKANDFVEYDPYVFVKL